MDQVGTVAMHEPFTSMHTQGFALAKDVQRINSLITQKGYDNYIECMHTQTHGTQIHLRWNTFGIYFISFRV